MSRMAHMKIEQRPITDDQPIRRPSSQEAFGLLLFCILKGGFEIPSPHATRNTLDQRHFKFF